MKVKCSKISQLKKKEEKIIRLHRFSEVSNFFFSNF